jgi:hypothetical protein
VKKVKKIIELLNTARKKEDWRDYDTLVKLAIAYLHKLQDPTPLTPDQFREIEGEKYPDDGLVYFEYGGKWHYDLYRKVKAERVLKITNVVCAYNLTEPPDPAWRPE